MKRFHCSFYNAIRITILSLLFVWLPQHTYANSPAPESAHEIMTEQLLMPHRIDNHLLKQKIHHTALAINAGLDIKNNAELLTSLIKLNEEHTEEMNNLVRATVICQTSNIMKKNKHSHCIDYRDYQEPLYVVCGKRKSDGTFATMHLHQQLTKHTHLYLGKIKTAVQLGEPHPVEELRNDQDILKELIAQEKLLNDLKACLDRIKEFEEKVLSLWDKPTTQAVQAQGLAVLSDPASAAFVQTMQEFENHVCKNEGKNIQTMMRDFNQSSLSLAGSDVFSLCFATSMAQTTVNFIGQGFSNFSTELQAAFSLFSNLSLTTVMPVLGISASYMFINSLINEHINQWMAELSPQEKRQLCATHPLIKYKHLLVLLPIMLGLFCTGTSPMLLLTKLLSSPILAALPLGLMKLFSAANGILFSLANAASNLWINPKKIILEKTQSQEKIIPVLQAFKQMMKELEILQKLIRSNKILAEKMKLTVQALDPEQCLKNKIFFFKRKKMTTLISESKNQQQKLENFLAILEQIPQNTNQPKGFFSRITSKLRARFSYDATAAYNLLVEIKDLFTQALDGVGDISMRVGFAFFINEHKETNQTPVCFPTYEEGTQPHFKAKKLWLPHLLDGKTSIIPNDLEIGGPDNAHVALISGTNQWGKTSLIRATACYYVMAYHLGFVAAETGSSTTPTHIFIAINGTDDISKGESGFGGEVAALKKCTKIMNDLKKSESCVVLIDELLGKANCGGFFSTEFMQQNFSRWCGKGLFLVSSLFEEPKYLACNPGTQQHFANYQFTGAKYTLAPGACFNPAHTPVTIERILHDQTTFPNLETMEAAGLINRNLCLLSARSKTF